MGSGNGAELEFVKGTTEQDPAVAEGFGLAMENGITIHNPDAAETNNGCPNKPIGEAAGASGERIEGLIADKKIKALDPVEKSESDGGNPSEKAQRDQDVQNGHPKELQKKKSVLSQSQTFPSKTNLGSHSRKGTAVTTQPKDASNGILPAVQAPFSAAPRTRRSLPAVDAVVEGTSETGIYSTPHARRNTIAGFSSRLEERAEKRKEFYMKLEEKNLAKEAEQTNLQAKSKENQEAEIRRLRKSLNFKATPMPSFYQEPGPPKTELKKIPPTRAKSPKLGRRKPSSATTADTSEAEVPSGNRRLTPSTKLNEDAAPTNRGGSTPKKPPQRTLSKLPSQKSKTAAAESKPVAAKPKVASMKVEKPKPEASENKATEAPTEAGAAVEPATENRVDEEDENSDLNPSVASSTGIATLEVPVQG